tara:strand:+ start:315 stop:866 length:552 start_codon:yes stop_codon:yes gene_type:complete
VNIQLANNARIVFVGNNLFILVLPEKCDTQSKEGIVSVQGLLCQKRYQSNLVVLTSLHLWTTEIRLACSAGVDLKLLPTDAAAMCVNAVPKGLVKSLRHQGSSPSAEVFTVLAVATLVGAVDDMFAVVRPGQALCGFVCAATLWALGVLGTENPGGVSWIGFRWGFTAYINDAAKHRIQSVGT